MSYRGQTALVVGAGRSGIAATRFLLARGARVILTDTQTREALEGKILPLIELAEHSGELLLELSLHRNESFKNCDFVVVSPGVPLSLPVFEISRKAGVPILAEVELASRHLKGRIIGITGSNGKTTTTTLVSELLSSAGLNGYAAGNIGAPLIDFAADSSPEDIYAVELSSFQLEAVLDLRPFIGCILNLTPDHMDRYDAFEDYVAAKRRIFMNQQSADFAVLNADDSTAAAMERDLRARAVWFSRRETIPYGAFVRNGRVVFRSKDGETELFETDAIPLKGTHNLENVLAACTMAILAGAQPDSLEAGVRQFKGVEHRIEFVRRLDEVQYYNDSKATNVAATVKSLEAFPQNILLIAGGRDKEGDFTLLRSPVRQRVKHLVLIGEAGQKIKDAVSGVTDATDAQSMEEAVAICRKLAQPGDIVLLAPACASFDMFENYEHRGRAFKEAVNEL